MKKVFLSLCCLVSCLCGDENLLDVESDTCVLEGKKLVLSGSVAIDHDFGHITADEAILYADPEEKKLSVGLFELKNNVVFVSKDGSELSCGIAQFNYKTLESTFKGLEPDDFVIFHENAKNNGSSAFVVKSRAMQATFFKGDLHDEKHTFINEIIAIKDVQVDYDNRFRITADRGIYLRSKDLENLKETKGLPGTVVLSMENSRDVCQLDSLGGDHISSQSVHVDTVKRTINFRDPQGIVNISRNQSDPSLAFSAINLLWELDRDFLRLSRNVVLEIPDTGTLTTNKELEIYYHVVEGKRELRSIESHGETMLTHPEKLSGYEHHLYCYGNFIVDHEKMTITIDSPSDSQGIVNVNKQVVFRDSLGELHSNKLIIFYQNIDGKISPLRMQAEGQVYMLDRKGVPANDEAALLRYALADKVEYTFANKEALFTAKKKQRVLLFDKINNLQLSAPALKITRDGTTHKEAIKGIGDVRFSFRENEVEQFKDRFEVLPLK